ncbi:MAG: hypothetical protein ACD_38C00091G0007 [uncultured bacterium]|uniref:Uncharacterized protein n=1 Tax=Candidatus Daviesbacteria bacterium GW2011_GWC2_40_12 TaxID=1618431 RepID=A0A0G0TWR6_9BACT|nr:MAG: hypothetical protein ACD_38C00091G0007 [uncultured bacterium]KKQ82965.1 MAG: hypothetical protein UT04_C0042G0009 [Candidatus Daviesbacteria bacterium GW2011_GWF2_38_7]KKR16791.1 MAG: hypothetical protein UT45_C0004G0122 [Candidatus Daviesbacteria bacterium GW2011_GWA2_39_33]KKR24503.1 MAG: hypothetical protein UT54_C0018G0003 [Candidatus Daviesbacteria bacterium GW2011_GWB1_39_5]KKR42427.1 MAG: hypothetical protein UT77_C0002G0080 [Candidatus Daviesbacteria bacterium GW2011_GWC2_40_12]
MAAKYQVLFQQMLKENETLLSGFKLLHDKYETDPNTYQDQYNKVGEAVMKLIQEYENMLTSSTEKSGYGKYAANLSDKFRSAVKTIFPKIDFIGVQRV